LKMQAQWPPALLPAERRQIKPKVLSPTLTHPILVLEEHLRTPDSLCRHSTVNACERIVRPGCALSLADDQRRHPQPEGGKPYSRILG
jgi:hypothetical protein